MIRKEITIFLTAIMFYTRIPIPSNTEFSTDYLNKSTRYFPFIGILVGGLGAVIFLLILAILPLNIAIILSMASTILITGAFHEDGFSDFSDGFGGGYTKERILEIMKDSRIGTYGAIALVLMLFTKFLSISSTSLIDIPLLLISAHSLSRFISVCMIYTSSYVREDALSKSKPIGHRGSWSSFVVALIFGFLPLCFMPLVFTLLVIFMLSLTLFFFRWYVHKIIGGYTGDVLGALQQISEVVIYLGFLIYTQNFICAS